MTGGGGGGGGGGNNNNKHRHRAGSLRQSNKRHKTSGGSSSKRLLSRRAGAGRVQTKHQRQSVKHGGNAGGTHGGKKKAERRLRVARRRRVEARRRRLLATRIRTGGACAGGGGRSKIRAGGDNQAGLRPPRVVGLVSLSGNSTADARVLEESLRSAILRESSTTTTTTGESAAVASSSLKDGFAELTASMATATCRFDTHRTTLTILTNSTAFHSQNVAECGGGGVDADDASAAVASALDLVRVCDAVLFLLDGSTAVANYAPDDMVSPRGERILSAVKAQGLPSPPLTVVLFDDGGHGGGGKASPHRKKGAMKRRREVMRHAQRFASTEFVGAKGGGKGVFDAAAVTVPTHRAHSTGGEVRGDDESSFEETTIDDDDDDVTAAVSTSTVGGAATTAGLRSSPLVRTLCTATTSPCRWADMRSHLVSDGDGRDGGGHAGYKYDAESRELRVTGYLRGEVPFDVDALVHVPHVGTYRVKRVEAASPTAGSRRNVGDGNCMEVEGDGSGDAGGEDAVVVLASPSDDPSGGREPIERFAIPDALEGEQNLIGFDDVDDDGDGGGGGQRAEGGSRASSGGGGAPRPAGWSDYQAAWLDAVDGFDTDADADPDAADRGELARELNSRGTGGGGSTATTSGGGGGGGAGMDLDDDEQEDEGGEGAARERRQLTEIRKREHREDLDFPDEVELKPTELARERLARYRSLKNFRRSYWDPRENLPESYASIYHFANFRSTQRDVMMDRGDVVEAMMERAAGGKGGGGGRSGASSAPGDGDVVMGEDGGVDEEEFDDDDDDLLEGCVAPGTYVTIVLEDVSSVDYARVAPDSLLTVVALLPHENRATVLHMEICQTASCDLAVAAAASSSGGGGDDNAAAAVPVKSKDVLTFRCGWRTWRGRPVFSQNNLNSDKHKFERFLPPPGAFVAASVFGPVTYAPCPVLVFRETPPAGAVAVDGVGGDGGSSVGVGTGSTMTTTTGRQLVAVGSVAGADADRVVVKRALLTGYPTRVHKRHATVKYMFYNPDDVKWFKPAGLTTKHGLKGHIMESVGEHGTMKCLFNQPIKQHDTVCLPLYKRIYPKYAPTVVPVEGGGTVTKKLVVL